MSDLTFTAHGVIPSGNLMDHIGDTVVIADGTTLDDFKNQLVLDKDLQTFIKLHFPKTQHNYGSFYRSAATSAYKLDVQVCSYPDESLVFHENCPIKDKINVKWKWKLSDCIEAVYGYPLMPIKLLRGGIFFGQPMVPINDPFFGLYHPCEVGSMRGKVTLRDIFQMVESSPLLLGFMSKYVKSDIRMLHEEARKGGLTNEDISYLKINGEFDDTDENDHLSYELYGVSTNGNTVILEDTPINRICDIAMVAGMFCIGNEAYMYNYRLIDILDGVYSTLSFFK